MINKGFIDDIESWSIVFYYLGCNPNLLRFFYSNENSIGKTSLDQTGISERVETRNRICCARLLVQKKFKINFLWFPLIS